MDHEIEVGFAHEVVLDNGSKSRAHIAVVLHLPNDTPPADVKSKAQETFQECKALVFTEVGVKFNTDEDTGMIVEVFPGAMPVADLPEMGMTQLQSDVQRHLGFEGKPEVALPPFTDSDIPLPDPTSLTQWLEKCWYALVTQPDLWIDNRGEKRNQDMPDFKAKDKAQFPQDGIFGSQYAQGLWILSRYGPPPAWAIDRIP